MQPIKNIINQKRNLSFAAGLLAILGLSSCSMVNEDLDPCAPQVIVVDFEYTYNMQKTDLINDHVGSVYLYVFDEKGTYLFNNRAYRADMGRRVDFSMQFGTDQLVPGRTYELVAIAQGNWAGYQASLETPGFTLLTDMVPGVSKIEDYRLKLDRDDDGYYDFGVVNYKKDYWDNNQMIDTLWSTKPDESQVVDIPVTPLKPSAEQIPDTIKKIVVPLMRITNAITVNLTNTGFNEETDVNDYNVLIDFPNGNGTIDFTGNTYPVQELWYRTLRKKMTVYKQKDEHAQYGAEDTKSTRAEGDTYAMQSVFGVSRMQSSDGSSLQIRDAETNELLVKIDEFSTWLANYFDHGFDDNQEFLDREYDFTVDIHLEKNKVGWIQIGCSILGWGKRIFYYDL